MCGKYLVSAPLKKMLEEFGVDPEEEDPNLSFSTDIFPTIKAPIIRLKNGKKKLELIPWGHSVPWTKNLLINARIESLNHSKFWEDPLVSERCLIPATSFFESQSVPGSKKLEKLEIFPKEPKIWGFAGLIQKTDPQKETFVLVTCDANPRMMQIHNRQPGLILRENYNQWLERNENNPYDLINQIQGDEMEFSTGFLF
jgi:putative SOS response-associated peptidase YedK